MRGGSGDTGPNPTQGERTEHQVAVKEKPRTGCSKEMTLERWGNVEGSGDAEGMPTLQT